MTTIFMLTIYLFGMNGQVAAGALAAPTLEQCQLAAEQTIAELEVPKGTLGIYATCTPVQLDQVQPVGSDV